MEEVLVGEVFTVAADDGEEYDVEVLATTKLDGAQYVAVAFVDDLDEDTEEPIDIFFFKVGEEDFETIDDDDEYEKVSQKFDEILNEEQ